MSKILYLDKAVSIEFSINNAEKSITMDYSLFNPIDRRFYITNTITINFEDKYYMRMKQHYLTNDYIPFIYNYIDEYRNQCINGNFEYFSNSKKDRINRILVILYQELGGK